MQIVRRAGENDIVLFGSLQQTVKQPLVGIYFLLNDLVIDCRFVLRPRCTALLLEGRPRRLLTLKRLVITRLDSACLSRGNFRTQILNFFLERGDLFLDFFDLGPFFRVIHQQLRALLF